MCVFVCVSAVSIPKEVLDAVDLELGSCDPPTLDAGS